MNKPCIARYVTSKRSKWLILIFVAFATLVNATTEQPAIDISIQDIDGQWRVEAKMQTQLSAIAFIELLDNATKNCAWMHNCKSVTLLRKSEGNIREIQTRFDSPWPFSDRLMLTKSVIEYNQDQSEVAVYVSESGLLATADELNDSVLVKNTKGTWRVSQVGEHYELSYIGSADADMAIPAFLLKHTLLSATQKTFENIYRLSLPKKKGAQINE